MLTPSHSAAAGLLISVIIAGPYYHVVSLAQNGLLCADVPLRNCSLTHLACLDLFLSRISLQITFHFE